MNHQTSMFESKPQIPRSPFASTLTIAFHVCLGLAVIGVTAIPSIPKAHKNETLTFMMAVLVAQTRVESGVRSALEVAYGGALGALVTLSVFQLL